MIEHADYEGKIPWVSPNTWEDRIINLLPKAGSITRILQKVEKSVAYEKRNQMGYHQVVGLLINLPRVRFVDGAVR